MVQKKMLQTFATTARSKSCKEIGKIKTMHAFNYFCVSS